MSQVKAEAGINSESSLIRLSMFPEGEIRNFKTLLLKVFADSRIFSYGTPIFFDRIFCCLFSSIF